MNKHFSLASPYCKLPVDEGERRIAPRTAPVAAGIPRGEAVAGGRGAAAATKTEVCETRI